MVQPSPVNRQMHMVYEQIMRIKLISLEYYKFLKLIHYCDNGDIGEILAEFRCHKSVCGKRCSIDCKEKSSQAIKQARKTPRMVVKNLLKLSMLLPVVDLSLHPR